MPVAHHQLLDHVSVLGPSAAEGYARIRASIDTDGALPAAHKALMVAVNAARFRDPELVAAELRRARELGLGERERAAAALTLLLSRGESSASLFVSAGEPLTADGPALPALDQDPADYLREYNRTDTLPTRMSLLAHHAPQAFEGYVAMHHAALRADPDLARLCELILCSLNAADLRGDFVAIHAAGARRVDATDAQLVEAVLCAVPVSGVGAWAVAAAGLFE
jgi:alkylhydroperoxidase/carboxymuconolactone decarboxylase family protein YurZ